MGNICEIFSSKEREKEQSHIATPVYIHEDTHNIPKGIPVQQYSQVQQYPQVGVVNHNPNGQPIIIYANQNPMVDGFTTGLLGGMILSDLADDCY